MSGHLEQETLGQALNRVHLDPLPVRDPEEALFTPTPDELADGLNDPEAELAQYLITYERVGRRGGRDGSQPPSPLTVQAVTAEGLAGRIYEDVHRYILSPEFEVLVNLEEMRGFISCGFRNGGCFTIEKLQTVGTP